MDRPVTLREFKECTVASMTRRISIDELDAFLEEALTTLEGLPGKAHATVGDPRSQGHPFVIYHDGLTVDHDGTVEVCQPLSTHPGEPQSESPGTAFPREGARPPEGITLPEGVAVRLVTARREATVRISKAELAFPDIDLIYEQLDAWIEEQGWGRDGAPREVFWADWDSTGMEEPFCDVCFPISCD